MVVVGAADLLAEGPVEGHRVDLRAADRAERLADVTGLGTAHSAEADKQHCKDGEDSANFHRPRL